jgi:hypothetical protein
MCQICALASLSQKYSNNSQLLNRPLSVLVNLNPKTPKIDKVSALHGDTNARPNAPV